ncbi:PREDICTED: N-acetyltransferase 6-like [Priapulus caudatus]|uniref:N-acetyltransferase 6-like n=1 Tax=Priapulus caudatus TaxID=37621 RepID=A0ABM1DXV3_PRICU|nr:PREDICTED: N-acetyltransferase 6-like [Priapulus caudatus]
MTGNILCLPLHRNVELKEKCADLLNSEWPRSKTARIRSLSKASVAGKLPCSLVLVENDQAIGHSRICTTQGKETACYIESVVISKERRGEGLGRLLMEHTEQYAATLGFTEAYLSTQDKQDFYGHIGYEYTSPIVSLGSHADLISGQQFQQLRDLLGRVSVSSDTNRGGGTLELNNVPKSKTAAGQAKSVALQWPSMQPSHGIPVANPPVSGAPTYPGPPPPPPPPSSPPAMPAVVPSANEKFWMKKALSQTCVQ